MFFGISYTFCRFVTFALDFYPDYLLLFAYLFICYSNTVFFLLFVHVLLAQCMLSCTHKLNLLCILYNSSMNFCNASGFSIAVNCEQLELIGFSSIVSSVRSYICVFVMNVPPIVHLLLNFRVCCTKRRFTNYNNSKFSCSVK